MPAPQSKTELASFLEMCNYMGPYLPCLSAVTGTLRQLNKKAVKFMWNQTYDRAFRQAKQYVPNAMTLKYFDPLKSIVLECDASGMDNGGTLLQDRYPITFVTQALTDTQKRNSNIEQELLVVVVAVERLHHYISVHTDHFPLVTLFQKCLNDTSPQLQCLLLSLSQYQMDVKYVTQKCVPVANSMSILINVKTRREDPSLNL